MTQDPTEFSDLAERVDRAVRRLSAPAAPAALLARVMRGTETAGAGPSLEWPVSLRIALSAAGVVLLVAALWAWPRAVDLVRTSWQSPAVAVLRAVASASGPVIAVEFFYVAAMCAVGAAAAAMLKHVALGGASRS